MSRATQILQRMSVPNYERIFVIGCNESRITVYSQQVRALNLAWSLAELSQIKEGMSVAIVGAGAAGLTAALAMGRLGARVKVFDQQEKILSRFRGNTQRYLHPHIFDFPMKDSALSLANLPLMNWKAATASAVVSQLERAWIIEKLSSGTIELHLSTQINLDSSEHRISWQGGSEGDECFDIIVMAVGVGTEKKKAGTPTYWENDSLSQITFGTPKNILISGTGDGGLVDVARAMLHDFDHSRLLSQFLSSPKMYAITEQLLDIESRALAGQCNLDNEYANLNLTEVSKLIDGQLRSDRQVTLYVRNSQLFSSRTMILNRVILECLRRSKLNIWFGKDEIDPIKNSDGSFVVSLTDGESKNFDSVILRHGVNSDLDVFKDVAAGLPKKLSEPDPTTEILWSADFFAQKHSQYKPHTIPRKFAVVEIDAGFGLESRAWSMNENGSVVGWSYLPSYPEHSFFIWDGTGLPPELGQIPGAGKMAATDINSEGDYVVATEGGNGQALLVSKGRITVLSGIGERAMPYSVNKNQIVVGWCDNQDGLCCPCIWENGKVRLLETVGFDGVALQINDSGIIVGEIRIQRNGNGAAARWRNEKLELFYPPKGYYYARAFRVNAYGDTTGYLMKNGESSDFFIWSHNKEPQIIEQGEAYGINDDGWVVGRAGKNGAFLYANEKMFWLDDLVEADWKINHPFALLNDLRIVGVATKDGISKAVLLVPEF